MPDSQWYRWEHSLGSPTANIEVTAAGVYRVTKPTDDGSTRSRIYPLVRAGDRVRFVVVARLAEGDPAASTTPSIGMDYPSPGDLVDETRIDSRDFREFELNFTVPFDAGPEQILPITIGAWKGRIGTVEIQSYKLYLDGSIHPHMWGADDVYYNTLGYGWSSFRLSPMVKTQTLLLGPWADKSFRMFGTIYGCREVTWSTSENHQKIDITTTSNPDKTPVRNVFWQYSRMGSGDSLRVAKATYQGVEYLALVGNENYIFEGNPPVFVGFQAGIVNKVVATSDLDAWVPAENLIDGEGDCDFVRNGYPDYYGRNILAPVGVDDNGYPNGGIIETGTNENGTYIKYANGIMECLVNKTNIVDITTAEGAIFRSGRYAITGDYPAEFASPEITMSGQLVSDGSNDANGFNSWPGMDDNMFSTTNYRTCIMSAVSKTGAKFNIRVKFTGYWRDPETIS